MIDKQALREAPENVKRNLERRGKDTGLVDLAIKADEAYRVHKESLDALRAERNAGSKGKGKPSPEELAALKELSAKIKDGEEQERALLAELEGILHKIPNFLMEDVETGKDDTENTVLREVGERTAFSFEPKDHEELGVALGLIDKESAAKVSGARFVYLKGDLVRLQFALLNYTMEHLVQEGFTPVIPPHIVSTAAMGAMGYLTHGGEEEIYHLKNDDAVLIGTSEQAIGPMHMDTIFAQDHLPKRYVGYSPCYRREAGSYGKDTKGVLRLHQFDKIEMFSFTLPENSEQEHERLLATQEALMKGLNLPYRVLRLCSGDTGTPSARTYDIETWMPGQGTYRETHSTSTTTDYQTRRLNIRFKRDTNTEFVHALNGTAFAIGRMLAAILENGQREDGTIAIPQALQGYMGGQVVIG